MRRAVETGHQGVIATDLGRALRRPHWYVLYGVTLVVSVVTAIALWVFEGFSSGRLAGLPFSGVVFVTLGIGLAALPLFAGGALSGTASGVTIGASPARLVLGTWLSRWILSAGVLVAAGPLLVITAFAGGVSFLTFVTAALTCLVELGVMAAVAVGLSARLRSRAASVLLNYLIVLLLTVGTAAIAPVTGSVKDVTETVTTIGSEYNEETEKVECLAPSTITTTTATSLPNWIVLIANPFLVVADASAHDRYDSGRPRDGFGTVAQDVRQAQSPQELVSVDDECGENATSALPEAPVESWGAPLWYVGLGIHVLLAALALVGGTLAERRRSSQP